LLQVSQAFIEVLKGVLKEVKIPLSAYRPRNANRASANYAKQGNAAKRCPLFFVEPYTNRYL
jgi:hypothetical protein